MCIDIFFVVLIFNFLMNNDVEFLFICLFPISLSSLMFKSFFHIFNGYFCFSLQLWEFIIYSGYKSFIRYVFFIYLFFLYFWLCWVLVSVRGLSPVAASGGHSSSWCAGLSLLWPLLFWSTGFRCAGSVIVAHGPSCSAACGIFPDQGSNPCLLHWQADSQPLRHQGSPQICILQLFLSYSVVCFFSVFQRIDIFNFDEVILKSYLSLSSFMVCVLP